MDSHGHGIYLLMWIKFFHFVLKCYLISKTIICFWRTLHNIQKWTVSQFVSMVMINAITTLASWQLHRFHSYNHLVHTTLAVRMSHAQDSKIMTEIGMWHHNPENKKEVMIDHTSVVMIQRIYLPCEKGKEVFTDESWYDWWKAVTRFPCLCKRQGWFHYMLTHCGRVTQICVFTFEPCKTGDANLRF